MKELSLFEILQKVNVNCKNFRDKWLNKDRLIAMYELLKNSDYMQINNNEDAEMLVHLYAKTKPSKDKSYVVISSHVDTVPMLTNFFTEKNDNGQIKGTFDNSLTNAVAVYNMLQNKFADNIIIAFTGDEENMGSHIGARQTMEYFKKIGIDISTYIVLDVTWDAHIGNAATIENVKLDKINQAELQAAISGMVNSPKIVKDNYFDDETRTYYAHGNCFSLCIPVMDSCNMHNNNGCRVDEEMMMQYANVLPNVANHFAKVEKTKTLTENDQRVL